MRKYLWPTSWLGFSAIIGVDEVGVGALAGPVCAAGYIACPGKHVVGLHDSKRLSRSKREDLFLPLQRAALGWSYRWCSGPQATEEGIHRTRFKLLHECALQLLGRTGPDVLVIVDGDHELGSLPCSQYALVKGDTKCYEVAAASVIAKVLRDRYMTRMARVHPGYGWASNMGYPTPGHIQALRELGLSPLHREGPSSKVLQL